MNILFYTAYKPSPNKGGTERASITLASAFKKFYGWDSYATYVVDDGKEKEECFVDICQVDEKKCISQIEELINKWEIDCFIDQGDLRIASEINKAGFKRECKIILAYHFEPEWDNVFFSKASLHNTIKNELGKKRMIAIIKLLFFDFFRFRYIRKIKAYCKKSYINADKVVLLSKGYFDRYACWAGDEKKAMDKLTAIPNALTYPINYDIENIMEKERSVLIVGRLDEKQKRLTLALKIWKRIKESLHSKGWILHIVGEGIDESLYKDMVMNEKIPDVCFHGRREPREFYEKAAIFIMTSKSEGWPLTISEAMQFGVVPVVYNTVASFQEMIVNDQTGYTIKDGEEQQFCDSVLKLMNNKQLRIGMARRGYEYCMKYQPEMIAMAWKKMIYEL